jgi:hypothetical protein
MIEQRTWGDVQTGDIVRDLTGNLHVATVTEGAPSVGLLSTKLEMRWIARPPDDRSVDVYVPTEGEAADLRHYDVRERMLRQIEERERTIARAALFRVDPTPRRAVALRDHIDWLHGVNVDDVLRRHSGTPVNPASKEAKKASIEELCEAHDEMHARPDLWPHSLPHHHATIGG